ncbi:MAG TPA: NYN domain-containing protein [Thermoanaerobaculia bacterium]
MPWLVDGRNLLGAMRVDRHADDAKRFLAGRLAAFARAKRTRVTLFFDGAEPPHFARHLGGCTVVFSAPRSADDLIVERCGGRGVTVVTSDRSLANRVEGRHVKVVAAAKFAVELERAEADQQGSDGDWEAWFADPKNRGDF